MNNTDTKISAVFSNPAYRRVKSEEGEYDAFAGWNAFAVVNTSDGLVNTYGYVGCIGSPGLAVFPLKSTADDFLDSVNRITAVWALLESRDPNTLPDYVTNPHREEYN